MIEDDDTRALFFDVDDFGCEAIVKPNGADEFTITGIFDARPMGERTLKSVQVGYDDGAQVHGNSPQFRCREADAVTIKAGRTFIEINGRDYAVFSNKPDNTGLAVLSLKVA